MIKRRIIKLASLFMVISLIVSLFSIFPGVALAEEAEEDKLNVIYNRDFEEGWNYTNGLGTDYLNGQSALLEYKKLSASRYNYYLTIKALNDYDGFLTLNAGDNIPNEGKLFFELDLQASALNDFGGIIATTCPNDDGDSKLGFIVSLSEGNLLLLGKNAGEISDGWMSLSFAFDFDYAKNTEGADPDEYEVTATYGGKTYTRVYKSGNVGFGIAGIHIGMQDNFYGVDRSEFYYSVDNIKLYSGTDSFTELPSDDYGTAVDSKRAKDFAIMGPGGSGNYVSGSQDLGKIPESEAPLDLCVFYNRHYSDGWGFANGFTDYSVSNNVRDNDFALTYDYDRDVNKKKDDFLNYYLEVTARNNMNGFVAIDLRNVVSSGVDMSKVYFEFDLKASAGNDLGKIITILTPGESDTRTSISPIDLSDGNLLVVNKKVGAIGNEWVHIALEFDFTYNQNEGVDARKFLITAYVGDMEPITKEYSIKASAAFGISTIRVGIPGVSADVCTRAGEWYGIDNLQLYAGCDGFVDLSNENYGQLINTEAVKDFVVDTSDSEITLAQIFKQSIIMKTGVNECLIEDVRSPIYTDTNGEFYGAPKKIDGIVMMPLEFLLDYVGAPYTFTSGGLGCEFYVGDAATSIAVDKTSAVVGGKRVALKTAPIIVNDQDDSYMMIAMEDVEKLITGYYISYDSSGFILFSQYDNVINRDEEGTLDAMRVAVERFIYTAPTEEELYERAKEYTNNFDHPYLYATQDKFDELYNAYHASPLDENYDQELISYIDAAVANADYYMKKYAMVDDNGNYLGIIPEEYPYNPYLASGGYDPDGGRLNIMCNEGTGYIAALQPCAFAYQVTHDDKYIEFAYDWTLACCEWEHWAPGHFIHCASTVGPLSVAYDWLYDGYVERGYDVEHIATKIFDSGVHDGWVSVMGLPPEHPRAQGDASAYHLKTNNWNSTSTIGMLAASLSVLDHEEYTEKALYLMADNIKYCNIYGWDQIAFDGSYGESAGYWAGTAARAFRMSKLLSDVFGTDYGTIHAPGVDITNYYGCHLESSDYQNWNYHDDWERVIKSDWYFLSAALTGDLQFAELRRIHIANGKEVSYWDCLFYDPSLFSGEIGDVSLDLDYFLDEIDAYVARESWNKGSLYSGLMGGNNSAPHGQVDSGNFIYYNGGIKWFVDLGADNYNTYNRGKQYYNSSAEGQNVVFITSRQDVLPYGQSAGAIGQLIDYSVNDHGSYAIIDNTSAYGGAASSALRGMFVTNDRKTVVVQDEISLANIDSLTWVAHYDITEVPEVILSEDGRTAYMKSKRNGKEYTLRVSMLTANRSFKFEIKTAYDFYLDGTPDPDYSESMGGVAEYDRSHIRKLVINAPSVLSFNVAIVMELIDPKEELELGYKMGWNNNEKLLRPMDSWVPEADNRGLMEGVVIVDKDDVFRGRPSLGNIRAFTLQTDGIFAANKYLSADMNNYFYTLASVQYAMNYFSESSSLSDMAEFIERFEGYKEIYNTYQAPTAKTSKNVSSIVGGMLDLNLPTEAPAE